MKTLKKILAALAVLALFPGCGAKSANGGTPVTASFYPLYIMLLNICEGTGLSPELLAPADTGCLHDYQLTTRDMQRLTGDGFVVVNGLGMEDFLEAVYETHGTSTIVASAGFADPILDADGTPNPHVWVSIDGAISEVERITSVLIQLWQHDEEMLQLNCDRYVAKLRALQDEMHAELDPFADARIITFHEAFPYFAAEFGFNVVGVVEREPGTAPSPRELDGIVQMIRAENGQAQDGAAGAGADATGAGQNPPGADSAAGARSIPLFAEPQYPSASAHIIARETGSKIYELDPCVTGALEKDAYLDAMRKNLAVLTEALSQ